MNDTENVYLTLFYYQRLMVKAPHGFEADPTGVDAYKELKVSLC